MKPTFIFDVMDLALRARENGDVYNPLFVGPPGLGKSQIVQAWCERNDLPFIDLRAAYLESPDLIGFPSVEIVNNRQVTVHNIPEFWPYEGRGVILLEEPNRGTTAVLNTFMQVLTDRKIHKYDIPEGWLIVGCINPENEEYDVNTMDAALKDRFEIFQIEYDKKDFVNYMKSRKWDQSIITFVDTNTWQYILPEQVSKADGAKYISPRTFSKLEAALKADVCNTKIEKITYESALGKNVGMTFYHFKNNEQPVTFSDLNHPETLGPALKKLKEFSDPKNYKTGHISITIKDIVEDGTIDDDLLVKVVLTLPADQGPVLIRDLEYKRKQTTFLKDFVNKYPEVKKYLKNVLREG